MSQKRFLSSVPGEKTLHNLLEEWHGVPTSDCNKYCSSSRRTSVLDIVTNGKYEFDTSIACFIQSQMFEDTCSILHKSATRMYQHGHRIRAEKFIYSADGRRTCVLALHCTALHCTAQAKNPLLAVYVMFTQKLFHLAPN